MTRRAKRLRLIWLATGLTVWLGPALTGAAACLAQDPRVASAITSESVGDAKRTILGLYVTAREAHALLGKHSDLLLIDVRSREQVMTSGIAAGTHKVVPFLVASATDGGGMFDRARMRINPEFLGRIEKLAGGAPDHQKRTIFVICPDGSYSALAVDYLADHGYANVYLIVDGIGGPAGVGGDGWRALKLPWLSAPLPDQLD